MTHSTGNRTEFWIEEEHLYGRWDKIAETHDEQKAIAEVEALNRKNGKHYRYRKIESVTKYYVRTENAGFPCGLIFHCPKCDKTLFYGVSKCPKCHCPLEWYNALDEIERPGERNE